MQERSLRRRARPVGAKRFGELAVATLLATCAFGAPAADAHEAPTLRPVTDAPPLHGRALAEERRLRAIETHVLGAEHAAEHARLRAYERSPHWRRELRLAARRAQAFARRHARLTATAPLDRTGRWTEQFDIPVFAINSIVLPTGKILWFAYPYYPDNGDKTKSNYANAWLWDPAKGTGPASFKQVDPPIDPATGKPVNIWCAGNSLLADGQVLVTGGNLKYLEQNVNQYEGLNHVYTFDPFSETWTRQPDMNHGRWYPSQLLMPDGRTFIMGGLDETGTLGANTKNRDLELFTPPAQRGGQGTISFIGPEGLLDTSGYPPRGDYYPHLFWMPNGRGLVAGPYTTDSWWFNVPADPATFGPTSWEDISNFSQSRVWGTAVLVPGGPDGSHQVVQLGGSEAPITGDDPATASAELFDEATSSWTRQNPGDTFALNEPRSHANTVLLPDGTMVEVGGGLGSVTGKGPNGAPGQWAATEAQKQIELWDPASEKWRLGPAQREFRTYHSTAVLLPDGRVVSAGDDYNGRFGDARDFTHDSAEIYEPPYLFDGNALASRPELTAAPREIAPGQSFDISADPSRPAPASAVLMGPGAATHAVDMNQRYVPLQVTGQAPGRLTLKAPPSLNVALPGYYMLFALDAAGTPSCAAWVRIVSAGPAAGTTTGACPAAPPPSSPTPSPPAAGPPAVTPPVTRLTEPKPPKVRVRLVHRSGKRLVRVTVGRWTKKRVRVRIVLRDRRRHAVRRFTTTVRTGRTTTLKARVPARVRSVSATVR